jgi:hypothetical protein
VADSLSAVKLRVVATVLAAGLALPLLAGCGEKEEPPTTGPVVAQTTTSTATIPNGGNGGGQPATDEEKIKATVAAYLVRADAPNACTKLVTPQFVKRSYGNVKGCEAARKPAAMARAVLFGPVDIGKGTTVTAKPTGGVFGGEKLEVTLINLDGQWTIDKVSSNAKVGP